MKQGADPQGKKVRTIEETMEKCLRPLFRQHLRFIPAGRTDAGVSAANQAVLMLTMTKTNRKEHRLNRSPVLVDIYPNSADDPNESKDGMDAEVAASGIAPLEVSIGQLKQEMRKVLPPEIFVKHLDVASHTFDPMSNKWKRYIYKLESPNLNLSEFHQFLDACAEQNEFPRRSEKDQVNDESDAEAKTKQMCLGFDITAMQEAATHLVGEHDFRAFQSKKGRTTTVRTLYECKVEIIKVQQMSTQKEQPSELIQISMVGNGFLMHMCRIICGTLFYVGKGYLEPSAVIDIIRSKDRQKAGPKVWAEGLMLDLVKYENEPLR